MKEKCGTYVLEFRVDYGAKGLSKSRKKARKQIEKVFMALLVILSAIYGAGYVGGGGIGEEDCDGQETR